MQTAVLAILLFAIGVYLYRAKGVRAVLFIIGMLCLALIMEVAKRFLGRWAAAGIGIALLGVIWCSVMRYRARK